MSPNPLPRKDDPSAAAAGGGDRRPGATFADVVLPAAVATYRSGAGLVDRRPALPNRQRVDVLAERCAGCQECIVRCPTGALTLDVRSWIAEANDALCVACRQCERTCPFSAVTVNGSPRVGRRTPAGRAHLHGPAPRRTPGRLTEVRGGEVRGVEVPGSLFADLTPTRPALASWDEAILEASRCLGCPDPTCVRGCPAHNDIPGFVAALARRDAAGAQEILRRTTVLPDVCSRVCDQAAQCEGACTWALAGEDPVAIGLLERFACDQASVPGPRTTTDPVPVPADGLRDDRPLEVVVVGSGPAAIGAAWELVQGGALVTVLERDSEPGGLLRWGIPAFVLPRAFAARPWQALREAGVTLWCDVEVTPQRLDGLRSRFDAVVMAHGAPVPRRRPFPGDGLDGVWDAAPFLRSGGEVAASGRGLGALLGRPLPADRPATVLVVGAGNTGMDVSRLAVRLGVRVICVGRADRDRTVVRAEEVAVAEAEGVEIRFRTALVRAEGQGWVQSAVLAPTGPDGSPPPARRLAREAMSEPVDLVVLAQGSRTDPHWGEVLPGTPLRTDRLPRRSGRDDPALAWRASGLLAPEGRHPRGITPEGLRVGEQSLQRELAGRVAAAPVRGRVWVIGDALTGPATVVEAMVAGRRAAAEILHRGPAVDRPAGPVPPGAAAAPPAQRPAVGHPAEGAAGLPLPRPELRPAGAGEPDSEQAVGVTAGDGQPWSEIVAGVMRPADTAAPPPPPPSRPGDT